MWRCFGGFQENAYFLFNRILHDVFKTWKQWNSPSLYHASFSSDGRCFKGLIRIYFLPFFLSLDISCDPVKGILGTFSNDDENVNVTDRKLGKRTSMLPRMPNRARLVVHISYRTPFAAICRLVENVSMFYLFSNFYLRILGISSI